MIGDLWAQGGPTERGLEVYTEGDCWALAYHVARLTGGHIVTCGGSWWEHVLVRVARNRYLDAAGLWSREQVLRHWRGPIVTVGYPAYPFDEYATKMSASFRFLESERTAAAFARRLVATELDPRLAA
jgi:hypothetical protein